MNKVIILLLSIFLQSPQAIQGEEIRPTTLKELLESAETISPESQLQRLEAVAIKRQAQSGYGKLLPELGVEGGGRSSREKEKRTDYFYYGYARYELSLGDIAELRSSLHRSELGELSRKQALSRAKMAVVGDYYRALSLQKQLTLKTNDYILADKQMAAARKRVDAGLATESDVLEFKMHQQMLENDLRILKADLSFSLKELERVSGSKEPISSVSDDYHFVESAGSFEEIWQSVSSQNVELKKARAEAISSSTAKAAALGEFLPRISAEGQYGKLMETDFVESRKNSWEVVGKVTIPLFNGGSSWKRYQEKSAEAERAHLVATQEETNLRNRAQTAFLKIQELKEKLKGEEQNVGFAEKYFEMIMSEYRRGVKNSPDVASATDKLFDARWRLFETKIDLSLQTLELMIMQGKTI